jgi:hypothetical protein
VRSKWRKKALYALEPGTMLGSEGDSNLSLGWSTNQARVSSGDEREMIVDIKRLWAA